MKRIGWSNIWKPHNTSDRENSRNRFNNMKQCNVTNREFHLALQWSTKSRQINVILTRTLPYSNTNYSDNLDNENGSKRLIRMRSVPRVVASQRAVAINKGPMMIKLMTILTIATNKSLTRLIGLRFVPRVVPRLASTRWWK